MVINLIDWILISRIFLKTNITTIKKVELIPNYKLSKVMGKKLQHDAKKPILLLSVMCQHRNVTVM